MAIYHGFVHWKWWFSSYVVYQRGTLWQSNMAMDSPQNQWTFVAGKINEVNDPFSIAMSDYPRVPKWITKNILVPYRHTCCYMFIYVGHLNTIHLIPSPKTCSLEPWFTIVTIQTARLCLMVHMGIEPAKCKSKHLFSATKWEYNLITG